MALTKRLVLSGDTARNSPGLEDLMRARGFQVYTVGGEDDLLDVVSFSQPDALLLVGPVSLPLASRLVSANQNAGKGLLAALWHGALPQQVVDLLDCGFDYVTVSYHPDTLAAQLRAVLRRVGRDRNPVTVIELGYLRIDLQTQEVTVEGGPVPLTPTEFAVLRALAERPGTVLPSGEIMQQVMGVRLDDAEAQDLLKVHIHRLRQKLEKDPINPRFIRTIRGRGYMYQFERRSKERTTPDSDRPASA